MTMIFLNLPVQDLAASTAFYEALGYEKNAQFSDATASSVVIDERIVVMLLTHEKFAGFINGPVADRSAGTRALYCLSADSREAVDALADRALAAGGGEWQPAQDHGFMYGRSFTDLDGHVWEVMWMDPAVLAGGQTPQVASA